MWTWKPIFSKIKEENPNKSVKMGSLLGEWTYDLINLSIFNKMIKTILKELKFSVTGFKAFT